MKPYEKPRLVALSLSGNDMLCAGCGMSTRSDASLNALLIGTYGDRNNNGIFDFDDATAIGLFDDMSCSELLTSSSYCKFTGASESQIFTS